MDVLGRHGVLQTDLAGRMRKAVGFRNVLVHEYIAVDDAIVFHRFDTSADLAAYVRTVSAFLEESRDE